MPLSLVNTISLNLRAIGFYLQDEVFCVIVVAVVGPLYCHFVYLPSVSGVYVYAFSVYLYV